MIIDTLRGTTISINRYTEASSMNADHEVNFRTAWEVNYMRNNLEMQKE